MEPRRLLHWFLILSLFTVLCVVTADRPLAHGLDATAEDVRAFIGPVMHAIEVAFGFPVSKFLTGIVLLGVAAALFPVPRFRGEAWMLALFGLAQLTTRLLAGVLKNVFLRPRPWEALDGGSWEFFTSGGSFPSGHAAHFWPLFFVAAVALPRWRVPLLLLAVAVSASRVVVNDHFLTGGLRVAGPHGVRPSRVSRRSRASSSSNISSAALVA